jgi:galactokinase
MRTFETVFGVPATVTADAPGRVNLLGEHTDYNDGFVLPTVIPQKTRVSAAKAAGGRFSVYAASLDGAADFTLDTPPQSHFASYVYGCLREARDAGATVTPLCLHVASTIPMGVGLSSSAALEVATLRALREIAHWPIDDVTIAQIAQRAEIRYAGVNCGIMDQMACSLAEAGRMLFLDTRTLERRLLPLPDGTEVLVVDSGIARSLAASKYNERRLECEAAARLLAVAALRDVTDAAAAESLPEVLRRRARHVITENHRVLNACRGVGAAQFGLMMNASHASLRDDYEVSIPALDELVAALQAQPAVFGARLTGAGFGGACVALCREGTAAEAGAAAVRRYNDGGGQGRVLVPQAAP